MASSIISLGIGSPASIPFFLLLGLHPEAVFDASSRGQTELVGTYEASTALAGSYEPLTPLIGSDERSTPLIGTVE